MRSEALGVRSEESGARSEEGGVRGEEEGGGGKNKVGGGGVIRDNFLICQIIITNSIGPFTDPT